jgi:hypothetical protein
MRVTPITNTVVDVLALDSPFILGGNAVVYGGNGIVLQGADDVAGFSNNPETLATTTTAEPFKNVTLKYRYIRVSTANTMLLLNN